MEKTPVEKRLETMKKNKIKRKTKKFIFATGITAVVFIVATYAWFMGITTVEVNQFEVDIAVSEGLSVSLDGVKFDNSITVTKEAITTALDTDNSVGGCTVDGCYDISDGRINHWVSSEGLYPISTNTVLDATLSRLNLYAKQSMTSSVGGYKLRASSITPDATTAEDGEDRGYILFDLFVKNASGGAYVNTYNHADDEGIFLTKDSAVTYDATGVTGGDGIQNSIRLGFYQLARTSYKGETVDSIQSMSCSSTGENQLQLCSATGGTPYAAGTTWNVWEPNDATHTTPALTRFSRVCVKRDSSTGAYSEEEGDARKCTAVTATQSLPTYAVKANITTDASPMVNIYDGLNGYVNSNYLVETNYYTDTEKNQNDDTKTEFMYLAPNSITKIRVYIWLEGQDIDNYDIANEYGKIKVAFGLTKDRYEASIVEETGEGTEPTDAGA